VIDVNNRAQQPNSRCLFFNGRLACHSNESWITDLR
jgi:hypothetical protein